MNTFDRKISGKGTVSERKVFTSFISNEDLNDFIRIIKSLENSDALIDGHTEAVKHEVEKQEDGFIGALLSHLAASLVQSVISAVVKGISVRGIRRAEK